MAKQIRVFIKKPKRKPYTTYISNSLENLQSVVGGYIETVTFSDMVLIIDEEGTYDGKVFNCNFRGLELYGPIIFADRDYEEITGIKMSFQQFKEENEELFND